VKRLRKRIKTEAENKACVAVKLSNTTTISTSITQGLLLLLVNLTPIKEDHPVSNLEALNIIEYHLPTGEPQLPLVLFPRKQNINDWYYHIHYTSRPNDNHKLHPVMLEIFHKKRCPCREVLIVKNSARYMPVKVILKG
jgi:hypothetical protein